MAHVWHSNIWVTTESASQRSLQIHHRLTADCERLENYEACTVSLMADETDAQP